MSTDTIFRHLGRLNDSHTSIGPGKTREEYLKIFSRASYSTQNEWPYSSPFAGFYDISNTSTGLILVNQRYKYSHLRGKILPKETSRSPDDDYKTLYEAIVEAEQEPKAKHSHKILLPRTPVDPYRHFDSRPQTAGPLRTQRNRPLPIPRRSHSVSGTTDRLISETKTDPTFAESLLQFYRYVLEKSQRRKLGLQQYHNKEPSNRRLRQSGIYRNPSLTHGQKLYLLEKCHIYDVEDSKARHKNAYVQVLTRRFNSGLNDPRDYFKYAKFLKTTRPTARPLNTGYFTSKKPHQPRLPSDYKKEPINIHSNSFLDKNDFITRSNVLFTNQKSSKSNSSNSSRRISTSSFSTNHTNNISIRLDQEPKQIPKIPVLSRQLHD
ncbi:unnamed protein product [Rotaria magnacalcarata]|uniref:Uncharacterized protein n=1 Tax=Rotaria magnacalcarata TaxID=392030 RepID=A0A819FCN6_9BILA|nr:unnamed protein product [Rotaria magnacalcarata]CAF3863388.1 unnamed protein product [Rotaria magnacalcarata]CAF3994174.1 unnamed protein product [Rotaria magnacalcarata]CAF4034757.1 unnamed protein product [Rotaria magnacalcarata]